MMRRLIQTISTVFFNGYVIGFINGTIFKGDLKVTCVPVLNCYSCPGALGSCPIGSLQAVLADKKYNFSFYVLGLIMLFGIVLGRFICGFLCPFGLLQDLLYKIPLKKHNKFKYDGKLRYLKYIVLIFMVIIGPLLLVNDYGTGDPYFCKYLCPAGTFEAGIPLAIANEGVRSALGILFDYKMLILVIVVYASIKIYRPFCKYLCPLGGIYGLFNKFSFYQMKVDDKKCIKCKKCIDACKMNVDVLDNINSMECIRCMGCVKACPVDAIDAGLKKELQRIKNEG